MSGITIPVINAKEIKTTTINATTGVTIPAGGLTVGGLTANATANVTISNVAPAAVGTATISAWLEIDVGGTKYYIPCWT